MPERYRQPEIGFCADCGVTFRGGAHSHGVLLACGRVAFEG